MPAASLVILLSPSELTFPSSSKVLFGRDAPLLIEIGVGSGSFLDDLSRRRPDANILGIDLAAQSIARSYRRLRNARASHTRLFKGDARWLVRHVVPQDGLQRVYVNFPDPWPRRKHWRRRLLQEPFLRLLSSRLGADGDVLLTTDHRGYFEFVLKSAAASNCFDVEQREPPEEVLETKWARKATTHFHAVLRPTRAADVEEPDVHLVDSMYHAVLQGDLPSLTHFEKRTHKMRGGVVVVMDAYRCLNGDGYAFLVHVEEEGLSQEVVVEIRDGRDGYVLSLRRFGEPLHTRGLSAAVRVLTDWFVDQGMTLIHQKF